MLQQEKHSGRATWTVSHAPADKKCLQSMAVETKCQRNDTGTVQVNWTGPRIALRTACDFLIEWVGNSCKRHVALHKKKHPKSYIAHEANLSHAPTHQGNVYTACLWEESVSAMTQSQSRWTEPASELRYAQSATFLMSELEGSANNMLCCK